MKRVGGKPYRLSVFAVFVLAVSCSSVELDSNFEQGRTALLTGRPDDAVAHFSQKAKSDPNYKTSYLLSESIWTYLGRAYYEMEQYPNARSALDKALVLDPDALIARLYHGMTLARSNERERGSAEIETSLREIRQWINDVASSSANSSWDSSGQIRKSIETGLAGKPTPIELVVTGQRVGKQLEEEIDRTRREKVRQFLRN